MKILLNNITYLIEFTHSITQHPKLKTFNNTTSCSITNQETQRVFESSVSCHVNDKYNAIAGRKAALTKVLNSFSKSDRTLIWDQLKTLKFRYNPKQTTRRKSYIKSQGKVLRVFLPVNELTINLEFSKTEDVTVCQILLEDNTVFGHGSVKRFKGDPENRVVARKKALSKAIETLSSSLCLEDRIVLWNMYLNNTRSTYKPIS